MKIPTLSNYENYTIIYSFNDSKMGFNNSVTVQAQNYEQAIEKAKQEIASCYGANMLKKFTFK